MTIYNDIRAALESQIANVTGIPPAAQRAWEGVKFEPTTGTPWVKMALVPATAQPVTIGDNPEIRHDGSFLVTIHIPDGQGPAAADTLADAVRAAFTVSDVLTSGAANVRFRFSERGAGVRDAPWYIVTVSVVWYCYAQT